MAVPVGAAGLDDGSLALAARPPAVPVVEQPGARDESTGVVEATGTGLDDARWRSLLDHRLGSGGRAARSEGRATGVVEATGTGLDDARWRSLLDHRLVPVVEQPGARDAATGVVEATGTGLDDARWRSLLDHRRFRWSSSPERGTSAGIVEATGRSRRRSLALAARPPARRDAPGSFASGALEFASVEAWSDASLLSTSCPWSTRPAAAKATVGERVPGLGDGVPGGPRPAGRRGRAHGPGRRAGDHRVRMRKLGDRRRPPRRLGDTRPPGAWTFEVHAWSDPLATWQHDAGIKIPAGVDVELMFTEGALLLERVVAETPQAGRAGAARSCAARSRPPTTPTGPVEARLAQLQSRDVRRGARRAPAARAGHRRGPVPGVRRPRARALRQLVRVLPALRGRDPSTQDRQGRQRQLPDRGQAARGAWPRWASTSSTCRRSTRSARSTARARTTRSTPGPTTPARPGRSARRDGGHDAIHPDLGTFDDFDAFVARAHELGLEVALDLALQAAPDHPWVTSHPEWFTTRADGPIAYAENPPKKYQDIYPINFDNDPDGHLPARCYRIVRHWMAHGVRIFRVDNPHTKPVPFWEWLLAEVRAHRPRRAVPVRGVHQAADDARRSARSASTRATPTSPGATPSGRSRTTCARSPTSPTTVIRPNFFVNTPDILHEFLQYGGPPAFKIRAVLAATGSPSWGVYAGYELFEHVAVRPGSEEYLDSEKYQIRIRDWEAAEADEGRSLAPYLTQLNEIRRDAPRPAAAAQPRVHSSDDDAHLVFSKGDGRTDGERRHRDRRDQPRPARAPGRRWSTSTCPRSASMAGPVPGPRRDHRRRVVDLGRSTTTCGSIPSIEPAHVLTVGGRP